LLDLIQQKENLGIKRTIIKVALFLS